MKNTINMNELNLEELRAVAAMRNGKPPRAVSPAQAAANLGGDIAAIIEQEAVGVVSSFMDAYRTKSAERKAKIEEAQRAFLLARLTK